MIPRVIHRMWFGSADTPPLYDYYAETWKKHHPGWETRLWREDTLPAFSCQAKYEQEGIKRRIDIARLEILRQFGGVIIDMDVEAVRPLDSLLRGVTAFVGRLGRNHIGHQVLGAVPNHPFFELAVARLASPTSVARTSSKVAGKAFVEKLWREHPEGITVFPHETFYFEPSFEPPKRPHDFPDVYAVHHGLQRYATALPPGTLQHRLDKLVRHATDGTGLAGDALARLRRAEERLRDGILEHEKWCHVSLRWTAAERERAETLLREARLRIEELERGLAARIMRRGASS